MSGRGIYRFGGALSAQSAAASLTIALSGDVERIQRREFVRIAAHPRRHACKGIDEPIGGETTTLDVSRQRHPDHRQVAAAARPRRARRAQAARTARRRVARPRRPRRRGGGPEGHPAGRLARADEDRLMRYIREREVQALRAARGR